MNFNPKKLVGNLIIGAAASACCFSCIGVDNRLGESLLPTDQQYDIHTFEFYLDDIETKHTDSLSAYSSTRITVGSVYDDEFGLSTRSSALTLVPVSDTLDFGTNPVVRQFHFNALKDTTSYPTPDQEYIIQNFNVYELETALNIEDNYYVVDKVPYKSKRITKGTPVYSGGDSLSFDFTKEFAEKYLTILQEDMDSLKHYTKKFPGIYITCDKPMGKGGRINMFKLGLSLDTDNGYIDGDFAELKITSTYDGEKKDTSFLFYFSPTSFQDLDSLINNNGTISQYCFNKSTYESTGGKSEDVIKIEGGAGLKPVISSKELREKAIAEISKYGDPQKAVISKASLILPYIDPEDEDVMTHKYPTVLSPTVKIVDDDGNASYANLTDASISDENQGDINRSLGIYAPDITHHMQEIINRDEAETKASNYDIWLLTMAYEITTTKTSGNSDMSEYYKQLAYSQYYNSMYGGYGGYGYGGYGYGGYGGYDNYSSYYTLMAMAQYAGSGSTSTSSEKALDKDRFYNANLVGPTASTENRPRIKITVAIPKD